MTSAKSDEDKYTLEYYTSGESAEDEPPFKYRTFYLDDALAEAWRVAESGGKVLAITQRGQPVFEEEELKEALEKISELDAESAGDERKRAARVLEESGKGETRA